MTDLLEDGLRPLKAALLVLLRHAGATKLANAPGVVDPRANGVGGKDTPRPIGPAGVGKPMPPMGVATPAASVGAAALLRGVAVGGELGVADARGVLLAVKSEFPISTGPAGMLCKICIQLVTSDTIS